MLVSQRERYNEFYALSRRVTELCPFETEEYLNRIDTKHQTSKRNENWPESKINYRETVRNRPNISVIFGAATRGG